MIILNFDAPKNRSRVMDHITKERNKTVSHKIQVSV